MDVPPRDHAPVSLASMTTLGVGGEARALMSPLTEGEAAEALRWAHEAGEPLLILGGGSNVVIADSPFLGTVLQSADYAIDVQRDGDEVAITVAAGVEWDELVAFCVAERFAGIESLSGIPGKVGAAPIQNIGAYGHELSDVVTSVRVLDRATGAATTLSAAACGFGYRTSHFKRAWLGRYMVTSVALRLRLGGAATVRYPEVAAALGGTSEPTLLAAREAVLALRRRKSMVLEPSDPNARSAGSFFMNPVVSLEEAEAVERRGAAMSDAGTPMPRFVVEGGVKLSAGWLIERAGFHKGFEFGRAGLSSNHALAIVNRGGARATDLIALAALVKRGVRNTFGVVLEPEPFFVGFDASVTELLR